MHAQRTPSVALDACIDVINLPPFPFRHRLAIFARHSRQTAVLVQLALVHAAVRGIDETGSQLGGILLHLRSRGSTDQRHHDRRPAQRRPARTMFGRLGQEGPQLLRMPPARNSTEDRRQVHGILLRGPLARHGIIITEPAILPHEPRLDGKLVGDRAPICAFSRVINQRTRLWTLLSRLLCQDSGPAHEDLGALSHAGLQVNGSYLLNNGAARLLWTKTAGNVLSTLP